MKAYGATNFLFSGLKETEVERLAPKADEVHIEVLYCGACHSKPNGVFTTLGLLGPYKAPLNKMEAALHRRSIAGSIIGSIAETQEVLDFCAEHRIGPEVQIIDTQDINKAYDEMQDEKVRFRYVIDMASLKQEA